MMNYTRDMACGAKRIEIEDKSRGLVPVVTTFGKDHKAIVLSLISLNGPIFDHITRKAIYKMII